MTREETRAALLDLIGEWIGEVDDLTSRSRAVGVSRADGLALLDRARGINECCAGLLKAVAPVLAQHDDGEPVDERARTEAADEEAGQARAALFTGVEK